MTSHLWGTRATPYGPSSYQQVVREALEEWGEEVRWQDKPGKGEVNPYASVDTSSPWPGAGPGREAALRVEAAALVTAVDLSAPVDDGDLDVVEAARVADWDAEAERLLAEARADRSDVVDVPLPASLSATAVARLRDDPARFARDLARPMPRPPSPAARFGTRFHAWVEARSGQQSLLDPDELPGRGDLGIEDDEDLRKLVESFEAGPFADRVPVAVEAPFSLVLAGQVVRGRIDAVYGDGDGYLVVDWKTGREDAVDPLQLALYRLAWAELLGVEPERVRACFHHVRSGRTVEPRDLPGRAELEELVRSPG